MHFGHTPPQSFITARFPNPKTAHLSPSNVSIATYSTPETMEEALALSSKPPSPLAHQTPTRQPLPRAQSSSWWLHIGKSPTPKQEPRSRKTDEATIITDATNTQPAFESDAFAIHMPTTREPILDPPPVRIKLPPPTQGQVDAYHTYKQKAHYVAQMEYKNQRPPSKIVSYDYAYANTSSQPLELDVSPPSSPPTYSPAGSFPVSPPVPQHGWARARQQVNNSRIVSEPSYISLPRKPVGLGNVRNNTSSGYAHADVGSGARATPSPTPTKIRVRVLPKQRTPVEPEPVQKESWATLFTKPSPQSSTNGSRTPSPTKSNFAYTSPTDTLFGFSLNDITGTAATSKAKVKGTPAKSRWAWLRPAGPRVAKPTATAINSVAAASAKSNSAYVDPFILHGTPVPTHPNTPAASRPSSPKKIIRPAPPLHPSQPAGKFEAGFAKVTSVSSLILKICLFIYALVGLYFVLDAIREAVHALGAPFRCVKFVLGYLWIVGGWLAMVIGKGWDRWGFKIALKGGWKGRWW
ncbi:hypothetical protein BDV96DRAFT_648231 [Lophiotrema nucula]|uniref:Uncharacterized protein n=1 Tax=Lophiotrema nucula TaxID=690887 RepID=A0A6A5Z2N1_9PLEO|nr:hypothetical protein BDV96DRAFT_648231 [Lophiotrema nucula]